MKKILIAVLLLCTVAVQAIDFKLLGLHTILADESHDRVLQFKVPEVCTVAIAFTGDDVASEAYHNSDKHLNAKVVNGGRTVIIKINFEGYQSGLKAGEAQTVQITTQKGRTHSILLLNLGDKYQEKEIIIKAVIKSKIKDIEK